MKKPIGAFICALVFLFTGPTISSAAALTNLNGLTTSTQYFATSTAPDSSHLLIQSSNGNHTFGWDGTPWLLKQGGTGATSFATSSVLFVNNGAFAEDNLQFFWDAINAILNIGGITTPSAKLGVRGSSGLGLFNLSTAGGSNAFYVAESGNVGVNTSDPKSALDVSGAIYSRLIAASSATINWGLGNVQSKTLNGNETLAFANGQAGGIYTLILKQDGTGNRTISWPATVKWANRTAPTLTSLANGIDSVEFIYDGANYLGSYHTNYGLASTLSNGLISYWKFDESNGNAADSVGSNALINNGGVAYSAALINNGITTSSTGSKYMSIAYSSQTGLSAAGDFSLSLWAKVISQPETDTQVYLVSKGSFPYSVLYGDTAGQKFLRMYIGGENVVKNISALSTSTFSHLVYTYTSSSRTVEIWLNGSSLGTGTVTTGPSDLSQTLAIGARNDGLAAFFEGMIDEVGYWNRLLASNEISSLYNGGSGLSHPF